MWCCNGVLEIAYYHSKEFIDLVCNGVIYISDISIRSVLMVQEFYLSHSWSLCFA